MGRFSPIVFVSMVISAALASAPVHAAAAGSPKPQWVTLGTAGGPRVHSDQAQIANALVVGNAVYLFDVGNGVLRQMAAAKLPVRSVRAIFISHHHVDHNADVGPLMIATWMLGNGKPVAMFGPEGTAHLVQGLAAANEPTELAFFPIAGRQGPALSSAFRATDLPSRMNDPRLVYEDANVRVSAISVDHYQVAPSVPIEKMPQAVAYRVETKGQTYAYSGDTGPSPNLEKLAKGADILVTEIVDPAAFEASMRRAMPHAPPTAFDALTASMSKNHLTAAEVGRLASRASVRTVVLTHFVPAGEDQAAGSYKEGVTATFKGPVLLARDLDRF